MIKVLAIGLVLALTAGAVSAQPKKTPARKARAPRPGDKKSDPKADAPPAAPATDPAPAGATPADGKPAGDAAGQPPAPKPAGDATLPKPDAMTGSKMKTDEKAGTKLERGTAGNRDVSAADEQKALVAFHQGNDLLNNGLFPQAVDKYRAALVSWDHPAIHYNLALALINLEQPLDVFDQLNKAIEYGAEPLDKDKFDHAKEYLKLVEGQLADVEVSCDKIGAKVAVDGKDVFVAPGKYTAKVRVGKHTFFADKQGYIARITAPFIGPGEKFRIELKVYTAEELTRYHRKWQNTWFPYVVAGAGAVVGLVAGGLELSAQSSYDQFNTKVAACNTMSAGCPTSTPGITSLRDSGDTKRTIGYVGYGIAGAAIATGAVLLWVNRRQPYQLSPEELEPTPAPIAVTPIVSPEMAGAMVQGHF
jgi:tetratricopeptide (TPR) repeat protein